MPTAADHIFRAQKLLQRADDKELTAEVRIALSIQALAETITADVLFSWAHPNG